MSFLRLFACVCAFVFSVSPSAAEDWRIVQSVGVVKAGGSGFMPAAVQPNQALPGDSWVETGQGGRVVLVRGLETIALGPNSRVQLPAQEVNGNTQVLQTLGKALYQVGKQKAPHFQVDTPYLAAVVKGTTFIVSVSEAGSSVDVTEGLVLVTTPDGSDAEFVKPGFSGLVSKDSAGHVEVVATAEAPAMKPASTPASDRASDTGKEHSAKEDGAKHSVITAAIGDVTLDIKAVSGGLASSIDPPANGVDKTNSDNTSVDKGTKDTSDESAKDESSVASVDAKADKTVSVDTSPASEPAIIDGGNRGESVVDTGGHGNDGGIDLSGGKNGEPGDNNIVDVDLGGSTGGGPVGGSTGGAVGGGGGGGNGSVGDGTGGSIDLGNGNGNGPSVGTGGGNSDGNGNSGNGGNGGNGGANANSAGGGPRNAS